MVVVEPPITVVEVPSMLTSEGLPAGMPPVAISTDRVLTIMFPKFVCGPSSR